MPICGIHSCLLCSYDTSCRRPVGQGVTDRVHLIRGACGRKMVHDRTLMPPRGISLYCRRAYRASISASPLVHGRGSSCPPYSRMSGLWCSLDVEIHRVKLRVSVATMTCSTNTRIRRNTGRTEVVLLQSAAQFHN